MPNDPTDPPPNFSLPDYHPRIYPSMAEFEQLRNAVAMLAAANTANQLTLVKYSEAGMKSAQMISGLVDRVRMLERRLVSLERKLT